MIPFLFKQDSENKRGGRGRRRRTEARTSWRATPVRDFVIWRRSGGGGGVDACAKVAAATKPCAKRCTGPEETIHENPFSSMGWELLKLN
jgi:hypothetical protein